MHNIAKRIATVAAAVLITLSPVSGYTGNAEAESAASSPAPGSSPCTHSHGPHHGKDGRVRAGGHFIMKETARLLDMECSAMHESLQAGKTLPQLAMEKKGWTEDQYVQKLAEAAGKKLDQAVTDGRLSAEEAAKLKERLPVFLKMKISNMSKHE